MSLNWDQVEAAFSSSASHFEGANRKLLQFCEETGKKVNETSSNLGVVKKDIQVLKQQAEDNIASLNSYRAQQIGQDDHLGQLERKLTESQQENRDLSQEMEGLKTKQALDQIAIQENKERIEKLEQLMQPVTFTTPIYSLLDGYLAPATGILEGQQASDGLGNQAGAELYLESQQVGTGDPTNSGELEPLLDSSAETLPLVPKTPAASIVF